MEMTFTRYGNSSSCPEKSLWRARLVTSVSGVDRLFGNLQFNTHFDEQNENGSSGFNAARRVPARICFSAERIVDSRRIRDLWQTNERITVKYYRTNSRDARGRNDMSRGVRRRPFDCLFVIWNPSNNDLSFNLPGTICDVRARAGIVSSRNISNAPFGAGTEVVGTAAGWVENGSDRTGVSHV